MKELLDEDALDPKKLFDSKEYNTLIIGREGFDKGQNNIADLLESLFEKDCPRSKKEEVFVLLKAANAADMLVDTIKNTKSIKQKTILTATCWETGLDFSKYFLFFTELACHENYELAFEAFTVLENEEGTVDQDTITKALELAKKAKKVQSDIHKLLLKFLQTKIDA